MAREVVDVESRIDRVTVYSTGARVRRTARLSSPQASPVRFVGLPLAVIDDTVRVEVDGPGVVTAIRTTIDVPRAEGAPEEPAELRAARRRLTLADTEVERLNSALAQLADASLVEEDPSDDAPAAWDAVVAARRALVAAHVERELALRQQLAAGRREVDAARKSLEAIADRERRASTAKDAKAYEPRKQVELELDAKGDVEIRVEYQVAAARWAPTYVAKLDGDQLQLELRAVVAQDSGEDWTGVALRLSTAEPERFSELPELPPQRIGRRQEMPARRGFRAPPSGGDALYADYLRGYPSVASSRTFTTASVKDDSTYEGRAPTAPPMGAMPAGPVRSEQVAELAGQVWDEESSRARPFDKTMLPPEPAKARGGGIASAVAGAFGDLIQRRSVNAPGAPAPAKEAAAPTPRLDYANLRMAMPDSPLRGRLIAEAPPVADGARVAQGTATIVGLALPAGCVAEWTHAYDYAFAADGKVDVASDGAWHSIAVTAKSATAKVRHVAVPREQPDAFRMTTIANPFAGPVLPGPIDVYDRGQFLITSTVDYAPPGANVEIGLGVDAQVKIARNTEFREEAAGMLRGALRLIHTIAIDVHNLSARGVDLEIRDRIPVTRDGDDDVEVLVTRVDPAWERWTPDPNAPKEARLRGGHCWKLALPPGGKKTLSAGYEVKIAGKLELVGGNRRES
jgi:Domain of unknown function (DUF4139)/N-terminal domain of unknown function (DUF4140)